MLDLQQATGAKYPFEWRGQTYYLSPLTLDVQGKFIAWAKMRLLSEGIKVLPEAEYESRSNRVIIEKIAWNSRLVNDALNTLIGSAQYIRLLLGKQAESMTEEDLFALQKEKFAEEQATGKQTDISIALAMIAADATPKADQPTTGN